jgi:hypothetical protein
MYWACIGRCDHHQDINITMLHSLGSVQSPKKFISLSHFSAAEEMTLIGARAGARYHHCHSSFRSSPLRKQEIH